MEEFIRLRPFHVAWDPHKTCHPMSSFIPTLRPYLFDRTIKLSQLQSICHFSELIKSPEIVD